MLLFLEDNTSISLVVQVNMLEKLMQKYKVSDSFSHLLLLIKPLCLAYSIIVHKFQLVHFMKEFNSLVEDI